MNPSHNETGLATQLENMSPTSSVTEVVFATPKGPAPKRRGRPPKNAKVTKDENSNETENEDASVLSNSGKEESRRRSSRIKKKEAKKAPVKGSTSNGSTLNVPLPPTDSNVKTKSKKHINNELDQPTPTADLTTASDEPPPSSPPSTAPPPQPTSVEDEGPKQQDKLDNKVLLNRTNEVCNESYPEFDEIEESIYFCKR